MARVLLMGTYATKRPALTALRAALEAHGLDVVEIDLSLPPRDRPVTGAEKLALMQQSADRAAALVAERCGDCVAALGIGGGTGAEIAIAALRQLPARYPKILLSPLPFDPRPMLADSAITLVLTFCDIEGMNGILAQAFENTAASVAGLARARSVPSRDTPRIAVTTLGATGAAGDAIARLLDAAGHEPVVFHANGYGGAAFARFLAEGGARGVIDLTTHELGRYRLAGAHVPVPTRFSAADALPRIVLPGGLNFLGLGARDTLSDIHRARPHYSHTGQFTHVKLTEAEMAGQAQALGQALNRSTGPCHVIVPMGGFSHEDAPGGAIEDPDLRDVFAAEIEAAAGAYTVARLPHHINDPATARAAVDALTERMPDD